jgi:septum formation protein
MPPFIYLASQSPRRQELLAQLSVRFQLLVPGKSAEEQAQAEALEAVIAGEAPLAYVKRVTLLKLQAAQARRQALGLPAAPILCADTTVALGRRILGKPADADDAAQMLQALAGRVHRVLTAVAVAGPDGQVQSACSASRVRFAPLSAAQIRAYVATGEPMGKAGAYAVQGRAAAFIAHIAGSYSGIMGLPLFETAQLLAQHEAR